MKNCIPGLFAVAAVALAGCGGPQTADVHGKFGADSLSDVSTITQRSDGSFDVVCKDGRTEVDTQAQIQANQACLPPSTNPGDPFDPASCSGPTLTTAQAIGYLDVPNGKEDVKIGRFQVARRVRTCYPSFPCGAWDTTAGVVNVVYVEGVDYYGSNSGLPLQGEIHIDYDSNKPFLSLYGDLGNLSGAGYRASINVEDWDFTAGGTPAPTGWLVLAGNIWNRYPVQFADSANTILTFQSATATSTCVRFADDTQENLTDSDGNKYVRESQLVVYGVYDH